MKLTTKLTPMSATELFKLQAGGNIQAIRAKATGFDSIPPQFGGLNGQRITVRESEVIEVTRFEGDS